MKRKLLFVLIFAVMFSCKSADIFIIENLNDAEKSKILTDKGIVMYENNIENKQEYTESTINLVKAYFIHALSLDNGNGKAKEYIKKIDSIKHYFFNKMIKNVYFYNNKKKRNERDEYYLCYFLEKALVIDPENSEALKLKKELRTVYQKLVDKYTLEGDRIKEKINNLKSEETRIKLFVNAYDIYDFINLIDNSNKYALKELDYYSKLLAKATEKSLKENDAKLKAGKYEEAYSALGDIESYSSRSYLDYTRDVADLKFRLFYYWGIDLYRKGKFQNSLYKIDEALAIKRDRNLLNIRTDITGKLENENFKNYFESNTAQIDYLIERGRLDQAKIKIDSLLKVIKDNEQKNELFAKNKTVSNKSMTLYDSAVEDYNNENFKEAIRKFQIVIKVIPEYKEVKNYLNKSVEKQKVVEMY